MKKRLLSVAGGLALLLLLLWLADTIALNIALAAIGGLAIYEAMRALKLHDPLPFVVAFLLVHCLNLFVQIDALYIVYLLILLVFCFAIFTKTRHYTFKDSAAAVLVTAMITLGLKSMLILRGLTTYIWDMRFLLVISLALGWICDTFAFTFGSLFGKRKLFPDISPNKTVAGFVGGIVGTPVVIAAACYLYATFGDPPSVFYAMREWPQIIFYALLGLFGAVIGIIGDLAASYIKRACGVKDFGSIMPGHGGALDRLDSVLFTCTFAAFAFQLFIQLFIGATSTDGLVHFI